MIPSARVSFYYAFSNAIANVANTGMDCKRALITVVISTAVCLRLFISNIYKLGRTTVRFAVPVYADWQRFLLLILKWLAGLALVQHYI